MRTRLTRASLPAALLCMLVLAGCGSGQGSAPASEHAHAATHVMPDGTVMDDSQMRGMQGMDEAAAQPSPAAAMACSDETAGAVQRTFRLATRPQGRHSFADQLLTCTYQLPGGDLVLSVKDLTAQAPGRAYYDQLRTDLSPAQPIKGVASFGFPAFETPRGDVVFMKDHKTLRVDASGLADSDLPHGTSRTEGAYGVAAAVIGCWSE